MVTSPGPKSGNRLVVAWHLAKHDEPNTSHFITKVRDATKGTYQISSDGWQAYPWAVVAGLHDRASHYRLVKVIGPKRVTDGFGQPGLNQTETTYVERSNGSLRQHVKRLTLLTHAFSKKWELLRATLALRFARYNFCRIFGMLRVTPAMEAGITRHLWTLDDLLRESCL